MARRVIGAALVLMLACGAAYALVGKLREPDRGGYPQRIGFDRPSDPLPARPGPLAATMVDNDFGAARDLGVTPTGRLYELPGSEPSLSPSGTVLLTRAWDSRRQVDVHDLSAGTSRTIDDLPGRFGFGGASWSPDERRVLVSAPRGGSAVVELTTGRVTPLAGAAAGFTSETQAVSIHTDDGLVARVTDLSDGSGRDLPLRLARPWDGDPDGPLTASVSPDGERLLLVQRPEHGSAVTLRLFTLADGRELASMPVRGWDWCEPSWRGADPVMPVRFEPGGGPRGWAGAVHVTQGAAESLVAVHPRMQSRCLVLTADALEAGPRWALFGTSTALVSWYALPALALASGLAGGVLLVAVWRRRRRTGAA